MMNQETFNKTTYMEDWFYSTIAIKLTALPAVRLSSLYALGKLRKISRRAGSRLKSAKNGKQGGEFGTERC
jgi:hypothetical protein